MAHFLDFSSGEHPSSSALRFFRNEYSIFRTRLEDDRIRNKSSVWSILYPIYEAMVLQQLQIIIIHLIPTRFDLTGRHALSDVLLSPQ